MDVKKTASFVGQCLLLASCLFVFLDVPLVLGLVYALPAAALLSLAVSMTTALWKSLKAGLESTHKALDSVKKPIVKKGPTLLRTFINGLAAAALAMLYWRYSDWISLWAVLFLVLGWISVSCLLFKTKKEPDKMSVVVRNPNEDFELKELEKKKESGNLWAASFDENGRALGMSRVVEKRGNGYIGLADGAKYARLFYWDTDVDLTKTPWEEHPEAGIPEKAVPVGCDVQF